MSFARGALAAIVLAGIAWWGPAQAQAIPQGSYLQSCGDAVMRGDTLIATCRRVDGGMQRTALSWADRCVGDIGNNNGVLQCNYADGRPGYGRVVGGPGPGYPPPGYAAPAPGYAGERWEECQRLRHRAEELRERLRYERDPPDRARIEYRLHEIRERLERCRY